MRNLAEYPITRNEVLACLYERYKVLTATQPVAVGDMEPSLLLAATKIIELAPDALVASALAEVNP